MQNLSNVQGVILTQKHLSFSGNFVHFFRFLHIIGPIYFAISRKDDGYDPLFLHDR